MEPGKVKVVRPESVPGVSERAVIDALPHAVIVTTPDGRILSWNRPAEVLYGWTEAEVVGRPVSDVLVPVDDRDERPKDHGRRWCRARRGKATSRCCAATATPVRACRRRHADPRRRRHGAGGRRRVGGRDATDGSREQQAADLAEHLALALDAGGLGTWRWDMSTGRRRGTRNSKRCTDSSPARSTAPSRRTWRCCIPTTRDAVLETVQRCVGGKSRYTVEHRVVWPDGSVHWLQGKGQRHRRRVRRRHRNDGLRRRRHRADRRPRRNGNAWPPARRGRRERSGSAASASSSSARSTTRSPCRRHEPTSCATSLAPRCRGWATGARSTCCPTAMRAMPEIEVAHVDPDEGRVRQGVAGTLPLRSGRDRRASRRSSVPARASSIREIDEQVLDDADATDEARGRSCVRSRCAARSPCRSSKRRTRARRAAVREQRVEPRVHPRRPRARRGGRRAGSRRRSRIAGSPSSSA